MNLDQIKSAVASPAYDFLRTNAHIRDRLVFLTVGGSHAYGTNTETSDLDLRGCVENSASDLIGFSSFDQFVNETTDTTIYGFNKLISLLVNCNPNTIELLGCHPEHYLYLSDIGRELLANRKLFLSQRACRSFGGYATAQLRRLENALARDKLPQSRREEHILESVNSAITQDQPGKVFFDKGEINLYIDQSPRDDLDVEIFADIHLTHYPIRAFNTILNRVGNVVSSYDNMNHRNRKKDDDHLNKHAMHLIRLYLTCLDILEHEEIITYRAKDLPLLMSIRRGEFQLEDGTYKPEFFSMLRTYEDRLSYAMENTSLPKEPDMRRIEELVMDVNRRSL